MITRKKQSKNSKQTGTSTKSRSFEKLSRLLGLELPIILAGIAIDRVVKVLTVLYIKPLPEKVLVKGIINLNYVENTGASFSMLAGKMWFFIPLTIVALLVCGFILIKGYLKSIVGVVSLSLIVAGAIGNFIDRLLYGYVIDMFEFAFVRFAIFNIADVCLTCGGFLLAIYILFIHDRAAKKNETLPGTE